VEEELLRIREEVFLALLKRVLEEIEGEVLRGSRECEGCGLGIVRNGQALRRIKTLLGVVELERVRLRCPRCGQERERGLGMRKVMIGKRKDFKSPFGII